MRSRSGKQSSSAGSKARVPAVAASKAGAQVTEHVLANGMRVLLAERHLDPVVSVMLWYRVGSRNEREHEAGVSHFLEHMMFKGSARFGKGEVDRITAVLGGNNNAFTTPDHTAYWFELAADRWERALEIEADRMRTLLLDRAEFEAEKAVVLEELAMGEDDPWRNLSHQVQALMYSRHPYRRPVIGYPDTLKALTVEDMRAYYERFYHPGNATLVVCGDFEPQRALALVRGHFETLEAGMPYERADSFRPQVEEPRGERRLSTYWDDAARRLCIAWPTAVVGTPDDYHLDVLSVLLTSGRLSRLHRRLVLTQRLATAVSTNNDTRVDTGGFWLYAECAQGVEPERLERAVDRELERLMHEPVGPTELRRAKAILRSSEAYDSETVSDLAEELGEFAVDARWELAIEGTARHQLVTAKEVQAAARRWLSRDRRVIGWCLPVSIRNGRVRRTRAKSTASATRGPRRSARSARRERG